MDQTVESKTRRRAETLDAFLRAMFEAHDVRPADAALLARHMVWAETRGISFLGLQKIPQYLGRLREGGTPAKPEPKVVVDAPAVRVVDCGGDWAMVSGHRLMEALIVKARQMGVAIGLLRNATSAGAMGYYADLATSNGLIGMAITNSAPLVAPPGTATKAVGNQAFTIGAPAGRHAPLLLDMATSAMTLARMHEYEHRGEPLPPGSALDASGAPTTDPTAGLAGVLLPMAGHRGFGLALMWEVLTGVLSGSDKFGLDVRMPGDHALPQNISVFMLAIDPAVVMPQADFEVRIDALIDAIHATPTRSGEPVRVPGERSQEIGKAQLQDGVAVADGTLAMMTKVAAELGIAPP